jgi:F-type H+-transporting ATPase subunit b
LSFGAVQDKWTAPKTEHIIKIQMSPILFILAEAAHGNDHDHGAEGLNPVQELALKFGVDVPLLSAQIICFLALAYVLWNYGFKPILSTMEEREKKISDGLRFAEEVKIKLEDAERKHEETLREASEEAQKTLALAKEQAKTFEEQLREDAKARAEDIVRKSREQMELERQTMIEDAKKQFANLVLSTTSKIISRELNDEEKTRFSEVAAKELAEA